MYYSVPGDNGSLALECYVDATITKPGETTVGVGANEWMRHFLWYYQYDAGLSRSASKAAAEVSDESLESYRIVLRPQ